MKHIFKTTIWLPIISSAHGGRIIKHCDIPLTIEADSMSEAISKVKNIAEGLHLPVDGERTPNGDTTRTWAIDEVGDLYPVENSPELRYFGDRYFPGQITGVVIYREGRTIGLRYAHDCGEDTATYAMWGNRCDVEWENAKRSILAKLNVQP